MSRDRRSSRAGWDGDPSRTEAREPAGNRRRSLCGTPCRPRSRNGRYTVARDEPQTSWAPHRVCRRARRCARAPPRSVQGGGPGQRGKSHHRAQPSERRSRAEPGRSRDASLARRGGRAPGIRVLDYIIVGTGGVYWSAQAGLHAKDVRVSIDADSRIARAIRYSFAIAEFAPPGSSDLRRALAFIPRPLSRARAEQAPAKRRTDFTMIGPSLGKGRHVST